LEDNNRCIYIIAVIGTWCGDTKEQFPVFQKILDRLQDIQKKLDRLEYSCIDISYLGVNRDKLAGETDISYLDVEFVPTFIFYDYDELIELTEGYSSVIHNSYRQLGRIVETPEGTMEEHILKILSKKE
jgi:hypothetical protein